MTHAEDHRPALLQLRASKQFGGVRALHNATLTVRAGTIHALVGENGAGKSTLAKIAAGYIAFDDGELTFNGELLANPTVRACRDRGIALVSQHRTFVAELTVWENAAIMGSEQPRGGITLDRIGWIERLREQMASFGVRFDPRSRYGDLSVIEQQQAEFATALLTKPQVLFVDELTAILSDGQAKAVLANLEQLRDRGTAVVFVTHRLSEVVATCDEVTVLRNGNNAQHFATRPFSASEIATAMIGSSLAISSADNSVLEAQRASLQAATKVLEVAKLRGEKLDVPAFHCNQGEIVGVCGIDGNGQLAFMETIAGLRAASGTMTLGSTNIVQHSIAQRRERGIAFIAPDRHHGGLWLEQSVAINLALRQQDNPGINLQFEKIEEFARQQIKEFDIRPPLPDALLRNLSGGNQQKVLVARELLNPRLSLVLACNPTRGVDLAAAKLIHDRLRDAAQRGVAVVLQSNDLDEVLSVCSRAVVFSHGKIIGSVECSDRQAREQIGQWMVAT